MKEGDIVMATQPFQHRPLGALLEVYGDCISWPGKNIHLCDDAYTGAVICVPRSKLEVLP